MDTQKLEIKDFLDKKLHIKNVKINVDFYTVLSSLLKEGSLLNFILPNLATIIGSWSAMLLGVVVTIFLKSFLEVQATEKAEELANSIQKQLLDTYDHIEFALFEQLQKELEQVLALFEALLVQDE